jgi:Chlorophyll A-B binding protein
MITICKIRYSDCINQEVLAFNTQLTQTRLNGSNRTYIHFLTLHPQHEVFSMMTQPQPTITPKLEEPKFGFNEYAERLNGRAAMIGFVLMVVIEYVTNQGVLSWLGLK